MKTTRRIEIADHLWDTFGRMAEEMGADRDVLVNADGREIAGRAEGKRVSDAVKSALSKLLP